MVFRGVEKKGLPVDQPFKLLSDLHIQLDDTLIGLALAAILGSHREATEQQATWLWDRSAWRDSVLSVVYDGTA